MSNFFTFVGAFLSHWWPLVSAGSILGVEEFVGRYWPKGQTWLERLPPDRRRSMRFGALVAAIFLSGYYAWSDEHAEREALQRRLSDAERTIAYQQGLAATDARKLVRTQLMKFYVAGGALLSRGIEKGDPRGLLAQWHIDAEAWATETAKWIEQNLGEAAAVRFADRSGRISLSYNNAANSEHDTMINAIVQLRQNLQALIETSVWDKPEIR